MTQLLLLLLLPTSLVEALERYDDGDLKGACRQLEALQERVDFDIEARLKLFKHLGACHFLLQEPKRAERAFKSLLKRDPSARLDPVAFPPNLLSYFSKLKEREERAQALAKPAPPKREERAPAKPTKRKSLLRAFAPFGLGQFQNGDQRLGLSLALLEGLSLSAGIISLYLFEAEKEEGSFLTGGKFRDGEKAERLKALYVTGLLSFVGLWGFGIYDALEHFEEAPLSLGIGPQSLNLRLVW